MARFYGGPCRTPRVSSGRMETRALRDEIHPNSHRPTGPASGPGGGPTFGGRAEGGARKMLAQYAIGEQFRGHFLLNRIELKKARNGNSFLALEIADPSGAISGNKFDATVEELR